MAPLGRCQRLARRGSELASDRREFNTATNKVASAVTVAGPVGEFVRTRNRYGTRFIQGYDDENAVPTSLMVGDEGAVVPSATSTPLARPALTDVTENQVPSGSRISCAGHDGGCNLFTKLELQ